MGSSSTRHCAAPTRTSTAVGDIARAYHPLLGTHIRVEHWASALHQPATAAAAMLGRDTQYDKLPYFYTDQYDLGMEYAGYAEPDGYDQIVTRGDLQAREFVAFWLRDRVLAGMNVNIWGVNDTIRALIRKSDAGRHRAPGRPRRGADRPRPDMTPTALMWTHHPDTTIGTRCAEAVAPALRVGVVRLSISQAPRYPFTQTGIVKTLKDCGDG